MKKVHRIIALTLVLLIFAAMGASCSSSDKAFMTLGKKSFSKNYFEFFLSRQKGILATVNNYGSVATSEAFWRTTISSDGTTYNEYWTSYIYDSMKVLLSALYLFEEVYGLKLPDETVASVDEKMAELVELDGDGSRSAFNSILSGYGVNYKQLREIYLLEEKIDYLKSYLYGADLSLVSDDVKEEYYQENFVRFKQVLLTNYYYFYETDEDGTEIYYDPETWKPIYDKSTGIRKFDAEGKALTDENGNIIYYTEDGRIAYDKVNGERAMIYDVDGKPKTAPYSAEQMQQHLQLAEDIVEFTEAGDAVTFEKYISQYSDDFGDENYPNGYYIPLSVRYSSYGINDVIDELADMQVGEIRLVESDAGYHVVMKYKLDRGAYNDSDNAVWFEDFTESVANWLFEKKCREHTGSIVVNDSLIEGIDMATVKANYNY